MVTLFKHSCQSAQLMHYRVSAPFEKSSCPQQLAGAGIIVPL